MENYKVDPSEKMLGNIGTVVLVLTLIVVPDLAIKEGSEA